MTEIVWERVRPFANFPVIKVATIVLDTVYKAELTHSLEIIVGALQ